MIKTQDQVGVFVGRQWQRVSAIIVFVFPSLQEQKQNQEQIEFTKASIKLYKLLLLCFCVSKLTINISSKVLSALRQPLPLLANPALSSLGPWSAAMNLTHLTRAAVDDVSATTPASMTTQPVTLEFGRCHHFALLRAVGLKVI